MARAKDRDEFRRNHNKDGQGHPAYVFEEKGNDYKFVGITHSPTTKGSKNIPLDHNPNPSDTRKAYMHPKPTTAKKSSLGSKLKGWFMSKSDKSKVPRK